MNEEELWEKYGSLQKSKQFPIGPHFSYQLAHAPRHILFSQNDELVHTGFSPLAHYLLTLCCGRRVG